MHSNHEVETEYDAGFIARLEFKWGEGFLSPGGPDEVHAIVGGINIQDRTVLDFGCGLGGVDFVLVQQLNARSVVGVDIDAGLIARATSLADQNGINNSVQFLKIGSGPLPFEDNSFDVIVSKDTILHVADKRGLYEDFGRVLKPGGWVAVSDWLKADGECAVLNSYFENDLGLTVVFQTINEACATLDTVGFIEIEAIDRHDWFRELSRSELEQISGSRRQEFVEKVGDKAVDLAVEANKKMVSVVETGELRPAHLRAQWSK